MYVNYIIYDIYERLYCALHCSTVQINIYKTLNYFCFQTCTTHTHTDAHGNGTNIEHYLNGRRFLVLLYRLFIKSDQRAYADKYSIA